MNIEKKLYQWDTEQKLTGCTGLYVDFPIGNEVYRVETADGTCIIPDELLQTSGSHKVYECMTNNTIRSFAFSVTPRPKPPDYVYTPTERLTFEGLVQRVDDAVADMIRRAESGEFDGHTPVKGTDYFTTGEIQQIQNEVSSGAIGEFKSVVDTETETFNTNAESKLTTYNENDVAKTGAYNTNASNKVTEYNSNAENKTAEFDTHTEQIQSDVNKLKSDLVEWESRFIHDESSNFINKAKVIPNSYIYVGDSSSANNGNVQPYDGWYATDFIELNEGENYYYSSIFQKYCAFYDSQKNFLSGYANIGTETLPNPFTLPNGAKYFRASVLSQSDLNDCWIHTINNKPDDYSYRLSHDVDISTKTYDEINSMLDNHTASKDNCDFIDVKSYVNAIDKTKLTQDSLINGDTNGGVKTNHTSLAGWAVSDFIEIDPNKTYYFDKVYSGYYAYYDENKQYIRGLGISNPTNKNDWLYEESSGINSSKNIPQNAKYLRVTMVSTEEQNSAWMNVKPEAPDGTKEYHLNSIIKKPAEYANPCDYEGKEITVFNKICCIGDSITSGTFNHNESGTVQYVVDDKYSYPTYLTKLTGVETINLGHGGNDSVQWWNNEQNRDFSGFDCAIINLGINDVAHGITTEQSGTALESIINALKTANNNIKIFIATIVPAYAQGVSTYYDINSLIKDLANKIDNCYLVDLTEYSLCKKGTAFEAGHLSALGYYQLAHDYVAIISYIIHSKPNDFKWVQFIGTDMSYD